MRRHRRGYSLIEMVAAMSVGTTLLLLATHIVHQTMHIEKTASTRAEAQRVAGRLSLQFRADVEQAVAAQLAAPADGEAVLTLDRGAWPPIVWTFAEHYVLRRTATADGREHRDETPLPDDYRCRCVAEESDDEGRIVLVLERGHDTLGAQPQDEVRVAVTPGRLQGLAFAGDTPGDSPSDTPLDTPPDSSTEGSP